VNVLLVRADGIGDALACVPLLDALRAAGHTVGAVLGTGNRDVFSSAALERVHVLERIPWPRHGSTPESRRSALEETRAARYDVALVASEEMDAFAFARDARIPRRTGYVNGFEKPLKTLRVRPLLTTTIERPASASRTIEHEVETLFRLGAGLVAEAVPTRDVARLQRLVLDAPSAPHGAVVLQVSGKLAHAGLGVEAYASLARLSIAEGCRVVVTGDDVPLVTEVARSAEVEARTNRPLREWKALIAGARVLITPDSGAAHVAGMVGVPCVDAFAPGNATARDVMRWKPWAAPHRTIVLDPLRSPTQVAAQLAEAARELVR
jgi:ADP-heptose:LPS heptosyltransferase